MAGRTSIVLFKQYATYQACLDIYSDQITTEDVFKKTFLYIMDWLKGRIGKDTLEELPDLKKYPGVSEYKSFDIHDMYGFKLLSETDIRLFNLEEENSWAMRITEPDNRAEFQSGSMTDDSQIRGRSFITEIALHKNDNSVTMAVQIVCKEPKANVRDALSFRPAFINSMFWDKELEFVETGLDRKFRFIKQYDEAGSLLGAPIIIDNDNVDAFVRDFMLNQRRQMPVVLCPESVYKAAYPTIRFVEGEKQEQEGTISTLAYSLMGYAHVVVVGKDVIERAFEHKKLKCLEYCEELQGDYVIFHKGFEEETGLPDAPVYCSLADEEDVPDDEAFAGKKPLKIMEELAKKYSVRKLYSFEPALFYRELKKRYYKYQGQNDTAAAIGNLENAISEKEAVIIDLNSQLMQIERDSKKRIDELKSKFDNSQAGYFDYKRKYKQAQKLVDTNEQNVKTLKADYEDKIRQKDMMINILTGKEIPEPDDDRRASFQKATPRELLMCDDRFRDELVKTVIKKELDTILHHVYSELESKEVLKKRKIRRLELLETILQYNRYLADFGFPFDALLYYPSGVEFYDGEIRDVFFDIIFGESDENELLNYLLEANEFDFAQDEKKKEIFNEINGYRHHQEIKGILERVGLVEKSSKGHHIYCYYGNEKYKFTVSGSVSDTNAGKNLAEDIVELCL